MQVAGPRKKLGPQGPQGIEGKQGEQGPMGPMPDHEWSGTRLRFQTPTGWGEWVELQGEKGKDGKAGPKGPRGPAGPPGEPGSGSGTGGGNNFSYTEVKETEQIEIPQGQQMLVDGHVKVLGHLNVLGDLINISQRQKEKFFYDLIEAGQVEIVEQNHLLAYKDHLRVNGHIRVNGRLSPIGSVQKQQSGTIEALGKVVLDGGGTAVVFTNKVYSTSNIYLTASLLPLNGKLHYDTVIDGVSFSVHTGNNSDSGHVVDWMIIN